jgi:hypothetical protein
MTKPSSIDPTRLIPNESPFRQSPRSATGQGAVCATRVFLSVCETPYQSSCHKMPQVRHAHSRYVQRQSAPVLLQTVFAMLTAQQRILRADKLTASQVGALMSGDDSKILNLWRLHIGDPAYVEDDLSSVWPVRLGEATEALNLEWYERKHGKIARQGEVVVADWMACTLDAWDVERGCPVECKHVGGREPLETVIARYQPQIHWQMMVTKANSCALSIIMGANDPVVEFLPLDPNYAAELMKRAKWFMNLVESFAPPVLLPAVIAPVKAEKIYPMDDNDAWKAQAQLWLQTHGAVETAKASEAALKKLVPADATKAYGAGVVITRNRAGSLALREERK